MIQAIQAGVQAIPIDQIARLATNSDEFYSVIRAASGIQPTLPHRVIATQAHGAHRQFPSHSHGENVLAGNYSAPEYHNDLVEAVEPIFRDIAKGSNTQFSHMNNVVMEKCVCSESTRSIDSYAVYNVIRIKGPERMSRVSVDFSFCLSEAIFEASLWEHFSATLHDDETTLLWDYVNNQTIDILF
ncbi:hypothetical protein LY76DRAFT_610695 [Colletotrichum caudatum]|nr:hypothetical protein LY76DRAFT_610695 [Colletotrichum caudatum]